MFEVTRKAGPITVTFGWVLPPSPQQIRGVAVVAWLALLATCLVVGAVALTVIRAVT